MTEKELLHIIAQGESETIEFKSSFSNAAIECIAAFANKKGGTVLIGVNDDKTISGVKLNKESIQNWTNEIKTKTEPSLIVDVETQIIEAKSIVTLQINEYPIKPVAVKGRYFIRKQNSIHLLGLSEIKDLYQYSLQSSWDSFPYKQSTLEDLDKIKVRTFIEKVNQSKRFSLKGAWQECLSKLKLINDDGPTNAAMLLFSKEDLLVNVHIGRFRSPTLIIDDRMLRGDLYELVEQTMQYITTQIKVAFEFTGKPERNEIFEYPLEALRELVINAIIHRDYTNSTDIQIKIFDNEITIFNPGTLYGGLTIDDLKHDNYQAQARNKLITEAFYLTKDIEKYGSGYRRVREQIAEYPSMIFDFMETSGGYLSKISYTQQKINTKKGVGLNVGLNVGINVGINVENIQKQILIQIESNPKITITAMAKHLKTTSRTIERNLDVLKNKNRIERKGSKKTGYWHIMED